MTEAHSPYILPTLKRYGPRYTESSRVVDTAEELPVSLPFLQPVALSRGKGFLRRFVMSLRSLSIFAFAVILGLSNQVAAVGFQPPSPDELKMTSEPQAPGAAAILLFRQIDRDDNGRTSHEDDYFRIKILKEDGRKYADVEIPYFKSRETSSISTRGRSVPTARSLISTAKYSTNPLPSIEGTSTWPRPSPFRMCRWEALSNTHIRSI